MPVLTNSLLNDVDYFAGMQGKTYANIAKGSQVELGASMPKIDAVTPLVLPNAQIVVTHTPTMFDNIPNANSILCALIQKWHESVTGIDPTINMSTVDGPKLQNRQTMKMPGVMSYSDLTPTFVFKEVVGGLILYFFEMWVKMLGHIDTGFSSLASIFQSDTIPPFTYSYFSMDIAVIQPDITLTPENIIDGYFITCMFPTTIGTLGIKRERGGDPVLPERSIEFTGVLQRNNNTYKVCQNIMELLQMHKVDFDNAVPLTDKISDKLTDISVQNEIETLKSEFISV